jgi:hypothetical protein
MRKWLFIAGLAVMMTWLNGCIVIDTETTGTCRTTQVAEPENVTIHEIDAIGKLATDGDREDAYNRVARRHGLSAAAQVHLVEAVFENLARDSAREKVLLTLIHNRCFHSEAKTAILDRIDGLARESSREKVLDAMANR